MENKKTNEKILSDGLELLAPAGDLEKLKIAILYGADAVYFGGKVGSLRAKAGNLSIDEIKEGVDFVHRFGKFAYIALNIYAHEEDISGLREYIKEIVNIPIDAFIVSDPGVIALIFEVYEACGVKNSPKIHLSTQANTTNSMSVRFWGEAGVSRIVLARELTLTEISAISGNVPEMELEAFVHGAMCISYSGRCLLSNYMNGRDANRGECSHPCRWNYALMEKKRPGEYLPVYEDERGTYIMNSKDLCMLGNLPDIMRAGVMSIKLEGRMKSAYYVGTIVKAYRTMLDLVSAGASEGSVKYNEAVSALMAEMAKTSHREFISGFFYDKPNSSSCDYGFNDYIREYSFVGLVIEHDIKKGLVKIEQRNKFDKDDEIEIFLPYIKINDKIKKNETLDTVRGTKAEKHYYKFKICNIYNEAGEEVDSAPHAQQILYLRLDVVEGNSNTNIELLPFSMIRKEI